MVSRPAKKRKSEKALVIVDALNGFDFPEGEQLRRSALPAGRQILKLKRKLKARGVPIIYVNDHFGHWQASWQTVFTICSREEMAGAEVTKLLKPDPDDYVVLKSKHSGFYSTSLDVLLGEFGTKELIICGFAGNICVLFTVNDAHMRGYKIHVPKNCIASNTRSDNDYALRQLADVFGIKVANL